MVDTQDSTQVEESVEPDVEMQGGEGGEEEPAEAEEETSAPTNPQTIFLEYLRSPIVELNVGAAESADGAATLLTAHEAFLTQSPWLQRELDALPPTGPRRLELPDETLDAIGCFLQFQYTGEYFPRRLPNQPDGLEPDPSVPDIDQTGDQLLKHARVYTLAGKLELPDLKTLAHSKIHRINSSATGEIAYARYVYANTPADDTTIRKPVAAFWATRSHVLRHEAEQGFKSMCLEFPQFGFDVLSMVLDQREKRQREREEDTPGRGKKRMRPSVNITSSAAL